MKDLLVDQNLPLSERDDFVDEDMHKRFGKSDSTLSNIEAKVKTYRDDAYLWANC